MKEYQYKVISMNRVDSRYSSEKELCQLGKEGWKLVSVCPINDSFSEFLYYFEREIIKPVEVNLCYWRCDKHNAKLDLFGKCIHCVSEEEKNKYPYGQCEECGGTLSRYGTCVDC